MSNIFLTAIAVICRIFSIPIGNLFQKRLTTAGNHPIFVNFFTYLILSIAAIAIVPAIYRGVLLPGFWLYSILGGIFGALGNGFIVKALEKGDLSILGPINSYKSVVGMLVGIFLLGEIPSLIGVFGIAIIIFGSYFVLDTTEDRFTWALLQRKEIQYRIWAMILTAIEAVFLKKVILASSPLISFAFWCWFGCLFSFFLLFIFNVNPGKEIKKIVIPDLKKYAFLVACLGIMQLSTNYVFENMPVGYALSLFQLSSIISIMLGYKFFRETDIRKKMTGAVIMIAGSVIVIFSNG